MVTLSKSAPILEIYRHILLIDDAFETDLNEMRRIVNVIPGHRNSNKFALPTF